MRLPGVKQNTENASGVTGTCPGRDAGHLRAASQNRDLTNGGARYGPGSAAHHAAEVAARCAASGERHRTARTILQSPRHLLLFTRAGFRGDRALVAIARLQALPPGSDVGAEIFGQPDAFGEPQGVAHRDV